MDDIERAAFVNSNDSLCKSLCEDMGLNYVPEPQSRKFRTWVRKNRELIDDEMNKEIAKHV